MKHLLFLALTSAMAFGQQPALKEQALPAIKGSILLPDGWHMKEESEDGVTVYQMSREKAEGEGEIFSAGLILSVTTKIPDRASMKPSEYAKDLLTSAQEEADGAQLQESQEGPLECLRVEYTIESDEGNFKVINLAKANDATGTLYFATWQSPEKEEAALKPVRDAVLSSIKVDPSF
jgi:hypothetical protein